jgi:hypothetical protein
VLELHGAGTRPFLTLSAQYVADQVPNARVHEIPGVGHAAPRLIPRRSPRQPTAFLAPAPLPA